MHWILGRPSRDFLFIFLPGIVGIAVSFFLPRHSPVFLIYALFASTVVDAGHVYTTAWRTLFRREERSSRPFYWLAPLGIVAGIFAWIHFKIPYLWSFVVYVTVYHQIAQYYGFLRWYEKLNGRFSAASTYFLLALMTVPFVLLHFRSLPGYGLYTGQDIFFMSNAAYFRAGLGLYAGVVAAWLIFEIVLARRHGFEMNRFFAIAAPAAVYGFCFTKGANITQILFPLFLAHGIPYMAVMSLSLEKLDRSFSILKAGVFIAATALIGGAATRLFGDTLVPISNAYVHGGLDALKAVFTGIYLMPLLSHYAFDGFIWKSRHPDAKRIYSV